MPPSNAWTMRSNPGQAEGRKAVDIGRSFKGVTGWLGVPEGRQAAIMPALPPCMKSRRAEYRRRHLTGRIQPWTFLSAYSGQRLHGASFQTGKLNSIASN